MNTSAKGSRFERVVVADLERRGWAYVVRASNSKGVADVVAIDESGGVLFVEAKSDGRCDPEQWNELWRVAGAAGAIPVLAEPARAYGGRAGEVRYWQITGPKDGSGRKQPRHVMEPTVRETDVVLA